MAGTTKAQVQLLDLDDITVDMEIQPRADGLNAALVNEYAEAIQGGAEFPPGRVFHTEWPTGDQDYFLSRGFHRYFAHQKAGREGIRVEVIKGSRNDAVVDACGANAEHGARRTNADKLKAVMTLDALFPKKSTRAIADMAKVDQATVVRYRGAVMQSITTKRGGKSAQPDVDDEADDTGRIEGTDGKQYPRHRNPVNVPPEVTAPDKRWPATELFDQMCAAFCGLNGRAMQQYGSLAAMIKSDDFMPGAREQAVHMLDGLRRSFATTIKELKG